MSHRAVKRRRSRVPNFPRRRRLYLEPLESRNLLATFAVNSLGDLGDNDLEDGRPEDSNGQVTFRAVIEHINKVGGEHVITFGIGGSITLGSGLPAINSTVEIDGRSPGGRIEITTSSTGISPGLLLKGPRSHVHDIVVTTFVSFEVGADESKITSSFIGVNKEGTAALGGGIFVRSSNTDVGLGTDQSRNVTTHVSVQGSNNRVRGNYVGLTADGLQGLTNINNYSDGIFVSDGANNIIGGQDPQHRNVIGGFQKLSGDGAAAGIRIIGFGFGGNPRNTQVIGNYVGTDKNGVNAIPNAVGIKVSKAPAEEGQQILGNVISGNSSEGIFILSTESARTRQVHVKGNIIGLQPDGTTALGNGRAGIVISASQQITVGGTSETDRNVISANRENGIEFLCTSPLLGQPCTLFPIENSILGNYIGTDKTGQLDRGNIKSGIFLAGGGTNNQIGGPGAGQGNLISGNGLVGIQISTANDNRIQGNVIGMSAPSGEPAKREPLGNDSTGIFIQNSAARNLIGGTSDREGNLIAHNANGGVFLTNTTSQNPILGNRIFLNGNIGIDLGALGITANDLGSPQTCQATPSTCPDTDTGANNLQNAPVIESDVSKFVKVTLDSVPSSRFRIELFLNDSLDPSGYGEGQFFVHAFEAETNAVGHFEGLADMDIDAEDRFVTATATRIENGKLTDTSEFSGFPSFVVNSTLDLPDNNPGDGLVQIGAPGSIRKVTVNGQQVDMVTLRAAIMEANALEGLQSISFNIPQTDPGFADGIFTIRPATNDSLVNQEDVPANLVQYRITDNTVIDAATQPGFDVQNRKPVIRLLGNDASAGPDGFEIAGDRITIRGFVINGFREDGIDVASGSDAIIEGNYIGVHHTGDSLTAADGTSMRNGGVGVGVRSGSRSNRIGGSEPGQGNVISGNNGGGIRLSNTTRSEFNNVYGNLIGTDRTGEIGLGNGGPGITVLNADMTAIGGGFAGAGNVISANKGDGILVTGNASSTRILGNRIGVSKSGSKALGNEGHGIRVGDQSLGGANSTRIGDSLSTADARNVVSGNVQTGIYLRGEAVNFVDIQNNYIGTDGTGDSSGPNGEFGNRRGGIRIEDAVGVRVGERFSPHNVISGNGSAGITIIDTTPGDAKNTNALIVRNIIGLTKSGQGRLRNQGDGVLIQAAAGNIIGGDVAEYRNIISGNSGAGVSMVEGATNNLVAGNYIGTNLDGDRVGNTENVGETLGNIQGVVINSSSANFVGFAPAGVVHPDRGGIGNLISGNGFGVAIEGSSSTQNKVTGNFIGTDATGLLPLGNRNGGVRVTGSNNTIGGTAPSDRNVIAGNEFVNIEIALQSGDGFPGATNNRIQGNFIGTDKTGQKVIGGTDRGIWVINGRGNLIGGSVMDNDRNAAANVIGGHDLDGIEIAANGADENVLEGNFIGVTPNLASIPNKRDGIRISSNRNRIGGEAANQANTIAFNQGYGIAVKFEFGTGAEENSFIGNSIFDNGLLGINLIGGLEDASGATENDALDADGPNLSANHLQNKPQLDSAVRDPQTATVAIEGILQSLPSSSFRIEYYASDQVDSSGFGEGQRLIGSQTVTTEADGDIALQFQSTKTVGSQDYITATATRINNGILTDTSEFSNAISLGKLTIRGRKFQDTNGNGIREQGEPGIRDWLIELFNDETGAKVDEKQTSADGTYSFDVTPARYRLEEETRADWIMTTKPIPAFEVADVPVTGKDFGNFKLMTISGIKFDDLNVNGSRESNEPLLTGPFTIQLDLPGDEDDDERSLATSSSYRFEGVGPGDKNVSNRMFRVSEKINTPGFSATFPRGIVETPIQSGLDTTVDFGNIRNMTVQVQKFHDLDGDGVQTPGLETEMLAGFEMILDLNSDNDDDDPATTLTDATGQVTFANVGIGDPEGQRTITVREVPRAGWIQTTSTRSQPMASGASLTEKIGNFREGAIFGFKYEDIDANNKYDIGDRPIPGITIILEVDQNRDGTPEAGLQRQVTTDSHGEYSFTKLGPGRYTIREVPPSDAVPTTNPVVLDLLSGEVHVAESGSGIIGTDQIEIVNPDLGFGNFYFGAIHGYKFNDLDGQGIDNGDPRIEGVLFTLDIDANEDGTFETNRTVTTDSQGYYGFRNLGPGRYRIREITPDGQQLTTAAPPIIDLRSGEVWVAQGGSALVTEHQVQVLELDLAFGNFKLVDLSGAKFLDTNADGKRDAGESGLSNWKIELDLDSNGSIDRSAITDVFGQYSFANVGPGRHTLTEVQQTSFQQTAPAGGKHIVTTESGKDVTKLDFGNRTLKSVIAGTVFNDADQNGVRAETETGLKDWIVYLDANNDAVLNHETASRAGTCDDRSLEPCWITDETGGYAFAVSIGSYAVREVSQSGWRQTAPQSPSFYTVQVTADDQKFLGRDFGNSKQSGAIYGYVFNDLNGDYFDDAEPHIAGWPITLEREVSPSTFEQVAETVSDSAGEFSFKNLNPGVYDVLLHDSRAELRFGFLVTLEEGDIYMAYPGQVETLENEFAIVEEDLGRGVFYLGAVRGFVFDDQNSNGQNNQEPRLADVEVELEVDFDGDQVADFVEITTTNQQGVYEFTELFSYESYRIIQVLNAGQKQTTAQSPWFQVTSGLVWIADSSLSSPLESFQKTAQETRLALGRFSSTWTNPVNPNDVSGDGFIAPLDALSIINSINEDGARPLAPRSAPFLPPYLDVTGDGFVAPQDALVVINYINANGAGPVPEGEAGDGSTRSNEQAMAGIGSSSHPWIAGPCTSFISYYPIPFESDYLVLLDELEPTLDEIALAIHRLRMRRR